MFLRYKSLKKKRREGILDLKFVCVLFFKDNIKSELWNFKGDNHMWVKY